MQFSDLPDEMLVEVLQYLSVEDLVNMIDSELEDTRQASIRFFKLRGHRIVILDWYTGWGESEALQLKILNETEVCVLIAYFDIDTNIPKAMERFANFITHPPRHTINVTEVN